MAALFDLDAQRDARATGAAGDSTGDLDPIDAAFDLIRDHIAGLEPRPALRRIRRYQQQLGALETTVVAAVTSAAGNDRAARRMLDDGKTSRRTISRSAKRAAAASKNKSLVDKMASGDLSEDQVDVIADTSARTDGAAATDEDFINKIGATDPDQAKAIADDFVAKHQSKDDVQTEHGRQRKLRRTSRYTAKKSGLDVLAFEGDGVAITNMFDQIRARANELYHADGGRDVDTGRHPRTHAQRMFDAAYELLCGATTTPSSITQTPRNATDGSGQTGSRSARARAGRSKPTVVVGLTLDHLLGIDPAAMAEQIGLGLIPDTVLADYLGHADIIAALFDRDGSPLWMARSTRHATLMQRYALIVRDKGCVRCGAHHTTCDAHHLMPWNAPAKGETNLDEMALLCGSCHRSLHAANHTLFRSPNGTWKTRPATPNETPPQPRSRNDPRRE